MVRSVIQLLPYSLARLECSARHSQDIPKAVQQQDDHHAAFQLVHPMPMALVVVLPQAIQRLQQSSLLMGVCFFILPSIWRVYFERKLEILGHDWLRQIVEDIVLAFSWAFQQNRISLERNREFLWIGENFSGQNFSGAKFLWIRISLDHNFSGSN
ncbi:hypothetical protein ACSBR2_030631 [Camellia fascicularis]